MVSHKTPSSFRRAGKKWTAEEEAELRERLAAGEGLLAISAKLERPTGGVFVKAQALRLSDIYVAASRGGGTTSPKQRDSVKPRSNGIKRVMQRNAP